MLCEESLSIRWPKGWRSSRGKLIPLIEWDLQLSWHRSRCQNRTKARGEGESHDGSESVAALGRPEGFHHLPSFFTARRGVQRRCNLLCDRRNPGKLCFGNGGRAVYFCRVDFTLIWQPPCRSSSSLARKLAVSIIHGGRTIYFVLAAGVILGL